jgi:hypothetical protein
MKTYEKTIEPLYNLYLSNSNTSLFRVQRYDCFRTQQWIFAIYSLKMHFS